MNKSKLLVFVALISLGMTLNCQSRLSADCSRLCSLPYDQRNTTFLSQPVKRQIDLYLECACKEDSITSDHRFSGYIAKNGKEALPYLVERLKSEENENRQSKIISVLSQVSHDDVRGRRDIVDLVNRTVANMKGSYLARLRGDDTTKKYAQGLAEQIELNSKESDRP